MTHAARQIYRQALDLSLDDRAELTDLLVARLREATDSSAAHLALTGALMLFETGQVSSGRAAKLAGLSKAEFLELCGKHKISVFNYRPEELEQELLSDLATLESSVR